MIKMRSLAQDFSSSRRVPPIQASKLNFSMASSKVTIWWRLRDSDGLRKRPLPRRMESSRWRTQPFPEFGYPLVAKGDDFREVVSGIDVKQREWEGAWTE